MVDLLSPQRRSENMARIGSKDTKPELLVRRLLHRLGYRYRLHARELPGKPDIVFRMRRKAIFVHGCFWHQHPREECLDSRRPKSNSNYWESKLDRNVERDATHRKQLEAAGWQVLVLWDCELRDTAFMKSRLEEFLGAARQ